MTGMMWVGTSEPADCSATRTADSKATHRRRSARRPCRGHRKGVGKDTWIGTDGGLVRFMQPRFTVFTRRDGLASEIARDIFQDEEAASG